MQGDNFTTLVEVTDSVLHASRQDFRKLHPCCLYLAGLTRLFMYSATQDASGQLSDEQYQKLLAQLVCGPAMLVGSVNRYLP